MNAEVQDEWPKTVTQSRIKAIMAIGPSPSHNQLRLNQPITPALKHHAAVQASISSPLDVSTTVHKLMVRPMTNIATMPVPVTSSERLIEAGMAGRRSAINRCQAA